MPSRGSARKKKEPSVRLASVRQLFRLVCDWPRRLSHVEQAQRRALVRFLGDDFFHADSEQIAQRGHVEHVLPELGADDILAILAQLAFHMRLRLLHRLVELHLLGETLMAGVQLDAAAFRDGLRYGPVHGRVRLAVFGKDIQQAAVTEQQFRDLLLEFLQRWCAHSVPPRLP